MRGAVDCWHYEGGRRTGGTEEVPMFDIRRREFITLLGGAVTASPLAGRAQQPTRLARIGFLGLAPASTFATRVDGASAYAISVISRVRISPSN
jgi:hypothetical protein